MVSLFGKKLAEANPASAHLGSLKVVVLGESGVGKTTLVDVLTNVGATKATHVRPTSSVNLQCMLTSKAICELWDVGGNPENDVARPWYYKNVNGALWCG